MSAHVLNTECLRTLAHVVRVLVSPLLLPSASTWRASVHDAMRTLFHADQAMTILPAIGELVVSHDLDTDVLNSLRTWFTGFTPEGRLNLKDPVVNEWNRRRRQLGLQVYNRDIIDKAIGGRVIESPFVREALLPNRMQYWQGVYAAGRGNADALLWVSHRKPGARPYGEATTELLGVLVPAFQTGLSALYRLDATRAAFDAAAASLIVFDPDGASGIALWRSANFSPRIRVAGWSPLLRGNSRSAPRRLSSVPRRRTRPAPAPPPSRLRWIPTP